MIQKQRLLPNRSHLDLLLQKELNSCSPRKALATEKTLPFRKSRGSFMKFTLTLKLGLKIADAY
jgi:hypothetical protein